MTVRIIMIGTTKLYASDWTIPSMIAVGKNSRMVGGMTAYSASKAATVSLTQSLAEEVASDGTLGQCRAAFDYGHATNRASFPAGNDFSKWPSVADVAETIAFLASPENKVTRGALGLYTPRADRQLRKRAKQVIRQQRARPFPLWSDA